MPDRLSWPVESPRITNAYNATQHRAPGFKGALPATNVGLDIGAPEGSPQKAVGDGVVVEAGWSDAGWGYTVKVRMPDGSTYRQSHMKEAPLVRVGDKVTTGQQIGLVGQSGNAIGPHVDLELRDSRGKSIDPTPLLTGTKNMATTPAKSNKTTAAEKRLEKALTAFGELDDAKKRAALKTDPNLLTEEQKLIDEEWRTGVAMVPKFDSTGKKITGYDQKPSELQKRWDAAQKEVAEAEKALADSLDADAKAAASDKSGDPRVVGRALVGPDGTVLYRDEDADKPDDPSLVASREAQTEKTRLEVEKLLREAEVWEKMQERLAAANATLDAAQALPDDPGKAKAIRDALRGVLAISGPGELERSIREEITQRQSQWQRLETSTGQRHDPDTLQPLTNPDGTPQLTAAAQRDRDTQEQRERENTRAAEAAQRQEQQDIAAGTRGLLQAETQRAAQAGQMRGEHFRTGIGSLDNLPDYQRLTQPLTPELAAQAVGMDPSSPKFRTIWDSAQQVFGGQPLPPTTPTGQTATTQVTQTMARPEPGPVAAIARGSMGQALDAAPEGSPGWAVNVNESGVQDGQPYDIDDGVAAEGPPPAPNAIQKLIRSLGHATPALSSGPHLAV